MYLRQNLYILDYGPMHFVFTYELQQNYILEQLEHKYFV